MLSVVARSCIDPAQVAEGEGEEDGEEEVDDLQAAFDILEMARISLEKKLEQVKQQESEDPSKGKEVSEGDSGILRHVKERLADTHDLLAEISLENERYVVDALTRRSLFLTPNLGSPPPFATLASLCSSRRSCTRKNRRSLPRLTSSSLLH